MTAYTRLREVNGETGVVRVENGIIVAATLGYERLIGKHADDQLSREWKRGAGLEDFVTPDEDEQRQLDATQ